MVPPTKRTKMDTAQLKPSDVKPTSNIFGDLAELPASSIAEDQDEGGQEGLEEAQSEQEDMDDNFDVDASSSEGDEEDVTDTTRDPRRKKNNPEDFATAMSKILGSNLTATNRKNPILARSVESKKLDEADKDEKLTIKARRQMLVEKKDLLEKNHNAAVVGTTDAEQAEIIERERQLRKTAQRGVVRLFNAIHASQAAARPVKAGAGVKKREAQSAETSKSVFLQMIKG